MTDYLEELEAARRKGKSEYEEMVQFIKVRIPSVMNAIENIANDFAEPASLAVRRIGKPVKTKVYYEGRIYLEIYKPIGKWNKIFYGAKDESIFSVPIYWILTDNLQTSYVEFHTLGIRFGPRYQDSSPIPKNDEDILQHIREHIKKRILWWVETSISD